MSTTDSVAKGDFPAVCASCDKPLFNLAMWKGHQAVTYCDGGPIIPGLPGGVEP